MLSVVTEDGTTETGSLLDDIVREGARRMLAAALEAEVDQYIAEPSASGTSRGAGWWSATAATVHGRSPRPPERWRSVGRACLVLMGVRADGRKELIALAQGLRESTESWADLLRDCRTRGMRAPALVAGDGAMGLWNALAEVFPEARHQRRWVHKVRNVMNALPKSAQPGAKKALQEIYDAEDRTHAEKAVKDFAKAYGAKWPKAVKKITDDTEELLAFYDFPAEHWIHLRTTNPIESTFSTVKLQTKVTRGAGSPAARPGDGLQARRVRPGPLAGDHRTPPRHPRPSRSPLRTGRPGRTIRPERHEHHHLPRAGKSVAGPAIPW